LYLQPAVHMALSEAQVVAVDVMQGLISLRDTA
jgi:hypothetical protein